MFKLHTKLQENTFFIKDLELCRVLLMNNALYPWLILVPKKANLVEIIDLSTKEQNLLMSEISIISNILKNVLKADKINIAALGNVVAQLHIHIIARFKDDLTFPNPIWVCDKTKKYQKNDQKKIISLIKNY
jgi:diadenosine tetraphosphate (Ap4A) HIT family hydrolase